MTSVTKVTIGTAAGAGTLVAQNSQTWQDGAGRRIVQRITLAQVGTAGTVWIGGGTDVATTTGLPFVHTAGAAIPATSFELYPGDALYGIAAQNGGTLVVLTTGN